ncbi:MAG: response regulator transcription factor [Burkholderiaceae bacterium]
MNPLVLLVEDDVRLAQMLSEYLGEAHFRTCIAGTGAEALARLAQERFDLVVLDLMLPDLDGLEVCRRLRRHSEVPLLMLTARGDATDRIVGLELGADDYLPKPFEPRELLARLSAILRRQRRIIDMPDASDGQGVPNISCSPDRSLRFGRLEIDPDTRCLKKDGDVQPLTSYQFDLLQVLAENAGRVLTRDFLLDRVKGEKLEAFDRSIDVHISRIRFAIEDDPKRPRRIITVRGAGYVFAKVQE